VVGVGVGQREEAGRRVTLEREREGRADI
jgi:hypothetical protein